MDHWNRWTSWVTTRTYYDPCPAATCPIVLRCRADVLPFYNPCRNRRAKTWMFTVVTTFSGTRCVSNQRVNPLDVVLPLSLILIHIQVIMSAVISYHPSSFCVFDTLRAFFIFGGKYFLARFTPPKYKNLGGWTILREQGKRNKGTRGTRVPPCVPGTSSQNTLGKSISNQTDSESLYF